MNDDEAGRYSLIGRNGERLDVVLLRMLLCADCGCVVMDTTVHDRVHASTKETGR